MQGGRKVRCKAHNLEIGGSSPFPTFQLTLKLNVRQLQTWRKTKLP